MREHTMKRSFLKLSPFALLGALAACGHAEVGRREVFWPLPPDPPRVKFVSAFAASSDLDHSGWAKLRGALLGAGEGVALKQPMGLALSDDGQRLYVADYLNAHVLVADFARRKVEAFAPDEPMGNVFNVALDAAENVYVTDSTNAKVLVFSRAGQPLRAFGDKDLVRPTGLAVDRRRNLVYVVDSARQDSAHHTVLVYSTEGRLLRELVGPEGQRRGSGDGQFYFPTFVALDPSGNVFVSDTLNFRVQVFDPSGRFLRKYGEQGDGPGTFNKLKGLAFDGFGNLYVVDAGHGNVQLFNRQFDLLMDFGAYVPDRLEFFDIPGAIAIDPRTNRIYVANEAVARINVYQLVNTRASDSLARAGAAGGQAPRTP